MKKFFKMFASLAIILSVVVSSVKTTKAYVPTGDVLTITKDAVCYFFNESKKWAPSGATPDKWLGHCMADVERKLGEIAAISQGEADKLREAFEWWTLVDSEDFVNIYHPNEDHTINEEEMIKIDSSIPENSIVIFMYGNAMDKSTGNMSAENIGRCKTVLALAKKYPGAYIALSGGHTAGDQWDSEAGASYKWLTQQPLPGTTTIEEKFIDPNRPTLDPSRFILDEAAKDTVGNINNSIGKIIAIPTIKNFITVTSEYHIPRATLLLMAYLTREGLTQQGYTLLDNLGWYSNQSNLANKRSSDANNQVGGFMQIWTNKTASATSNKRCSIPVQDTFTASLKVDMFDPTKPLEDQVKAICKFTPGQNVTDASIATFEFDAVQDKDHTKLTYSPEDEKITVTYTYGYYSSPITVTAELTVHTYGEPVYTWSEDNLKCTATMSCTKESCTESITETVDAVVDAHEENCEEAGYTEYTVTFENELFQQQGKIVEGEPALGHNWEFKGFEWAEDFTSAKGKFVCLNNEEHVQEIEAVLEDEVVVEPENGKNGEKNIRATIEFEGEIYTDVVDGVVVPFTGVEMLPAFAVMATSLTGLAAVIYAKKKH